MTNTTFQLRLLAEERAVEARRMSRKRSSRSLRARLSDKLSSR